MSRPLTGVILAGGEGRRMGGRDKALVPLAGRPLVAHVLERLRGQVDSVRINANGDPERYRRFGVPIDPDRWPGRPGPLAGMATALARAPTERVLVVPCDAPLLPADTAVRLVAALEGAGADAAVARAGGRLQPVLALLQRYLLDDLEAVLGAGERRIDRFLARHAVAEADFEDIPEALANVNTPEDLAAVSERVRCP